MRKISIIMIAIIMTFLLTSCREKEPELIEIHPDDIITMFELDDYMFRDDVQYVDLRNYDAPFKSGFIYSFELIPFFDYLDYRAFDRSNTYEFEPSQILNENELYRLFDKDKAIFLYADGCVRSGYLRDVLYYLGYERVYVLGGFGDYEGEYKVLGDGVYTIGNTYYTTYYDEETEYTYHMFGYLDMDKMIRSIRIDIIDKDNISLRSPNYDETINYDEQLTILEEYIVQDVINFNELFKIIDSESPHQYESIPGYTLGITSGLKATFEKLIVK